MRPFSKFGLLFAIALSSIPAYGDFYYDVIRSSEGFGGFTISRRAEDFVSFNNELFFVANHRVLGRELWRSNGAFGAMSLVKDIATGPSSSSPSIMGVYGEHLYFTATDGDEFYLYRTKGTKSTTEKLDIQETVSGLLDFNGIIYAETTGPRQLNVVNTDGSIAVVTSVFGGNQDYCKDQNQSRLIVMTSETSLVSVVGDTSTTFIDSENDKHFDYFVGYAAGLCIFTYHEADHSDFLKTRFAYIDQNGTIKDLDLEHDTFTFSPNVVEAHGQAYVMAGNQLVSLSPSGQVTILRDGGTVSDLYVSNNDLTYYYDGNFYWVSAAGKVPVPLVNSEKYTGVSDLVSAFGGFLILSRDNLLYHDRTPGSFAKLLFNTRKEIDGGPAEWLRPLLSSATMLQPSMENTGGLYFLSDINSNLGPGLHRITQENLIRENLTGDWVADGLNDQGLLLFNSLLPDGRKLLFAAWFIYDRGEPIWLAGNATYSGNETQLELPMVITKGLNFSEPLSGVNADREVIGHLTIIPNGCKKLDVNYTLDSLGAGSLTLSPLFTSLDAVLCSPVGNGVAQ